MAKSQLKVSDCLVLGEHPASYLAAAILREKGDLTVTHATIAGQQPPDRLVMINPAFFDLHPLLNKLRRKLDMTAIYGLTYLADDGTTRADYRNKTAVAFIASYRQVRAELADAAKQSGVEMASAKEISVGRLDEKGIDLKLGKSEHHIRALVIGGTLTPDLSKTLGFHLAWAGQAVHRYTFARLSRQCVPDLGTRPATPICLQLGDPTCWAWLFCQDSWAQVCVSQPVESVQAKPPESLLAQWVGILRRQNILPAGKNLPCESPNSMDISLAGALEHEGVGNRTLLLGPAGGFYSASTEDIYPNCWSALFASEALRHALKERHLQDALNGYRSSWRTTLGDYLRGPSVNLRYLLPLIYRNPVMTERISESILMGKGVVR